MTTDCSTTRTLHRAAPLLQDNDLAASVAFYTAQLGFRELYREEDKLVILNRDAFDLFLARKEINVDLRNRTARQPGSTRAAFDVYVFCHRGMVDALWAELKNAGVPMPAACAQGPVDRPHGQREFRITDPDGYELVFASPID